MIICGRAPPPSEPLVGVGGARQDSCRNDARMTPGHALQPIQEPEAEVQS